MAENQEIVLSKKQKEAARRIFIALDGMTSEEARELMRKLDPFPFGYKVGPGLIAGDRSRQAIAFASVLKKRQTMLDINLSHVPSVVASATREIAARSGVGFFTIQASYCGVEGMKAAVANKGGKGLKVIVATVPTSFTETQCQRLFNRSIIEATTMFADDALQAGCDGVVCPPHVARALRDHIDHINEDFLTFTPGIRLFGSPPDDHAYMRDPFSAIRAKAGYLIIGRPITRADDPAEVARCYVKEASEAY